MSVAAEAAALFEALFGHCESGFVALWPIEPGGGALRELAAGREGGPVPPALPIEPERAPGPAAARAAERERRERGR